MALGLSNANYHQQQLSSNIRDNIAALESSPVGADAGHYDIEPLNRDNIHGYKLSDLLNGFVEDTNTLNCFDECIHCIVSEYTDSTLLNVKMHAMDRILTQKCTDSRQRLFDIVIDSDHQVLSTLLRIARKMKAIRLVQNTQQMIHIPHNIEEVQFVIEQLGNDAKPKQKRKTKAASKDAIIVYEDSNDDEKQENKDDDEASEEEWDSAAELVTMKSLSGVQGLSDLKFTNKTLYNETDLYKKRDVLKKKNLINFEFAKSKSNEATQNTAQVEMISAPSNSARQKKEGHPTVKCEGCGNDIVLNVEYDNCITYTAKIIGPNKLFYFHDELCVTLRRMKESCRRYVLDDTLAETNRANTTRGYIKNLLMHFNSLISIKCVVPKPQYPVKKTNNLKKLNVNAISMKTHNPKKNKEKTKKTALLRIAMARDNAYKLIERQRTLHARVAKNFDEDYQWKFEEVPRPIQYANMKIYGESLYVFVTKQLQTKQWDGLWLLLAFIASTMDTATSLQLLRMNSGILCKVKEIAHLDILGASMIESADFTIAMALYLSAFMSDAADNDLSRSAEFEEIADKYTRIASNLVDNMESNHLLALLLETPTDITPNKLNVLEIAIQFELHDFMHSSRIQMLMASMWSEFEYLNPNKRFRTTDIELFTLCRQLVFHPATFYYCPVGRFWSESFMYILYVILVTIVVYKQNYDLVSPLPEIEWIMWIFNAGFISNEISQLILEGMYQYFSDVGNAFDVLIIINWIILFLMRFWCRHLYDNYATQCTGNHDKNATLVYMFVFCLQIIILWSRASMIFRRSRQIGPFLSMIPGMIKDILNWAFVLSIFFVGFCFGVDFIVAGDIDPLLCNVGGSMGDFSLVTEYIFILLMGQSDWSYLEPNGCISNRRSIMLKVFLWFFSILGTILLLNLLIAMMASTYERIREGTAKQVNFARAEQTYALAHRHAIIPPPLNGVVFAVSCVWFFFEFLVFVFSCGKAIININGIVPLYIDYNIIHDHHEEDDDNEEQKSDGNTYFCCGLFQQLKDPKATLRKVFQQYSSTARYCSFCRFFMCENGNISNYFELFLDYKLDEADTKFMKSLLQNDTGICPKCYRPYKKYNEKSNRLYRWQVILELISFYIFMIFLYLPLILWIAFPAIVNGGIATMQNVKNQSNVNTSDQGNRKAVFKDDKYLKLIESVIDEETLDQNDLLTLQIKALHKKLVKVNTNQVNTNRAVEKQSILINDSIIPYIQKINTKMDLSMSTTQKLHEEQLHFTANQYDMQNKELRHNQEVNALQHEQQMGALQTQLMEFKEKQAIQESQRNEQHELYQEALKKQNEQNEMNQEILSTLQTQIDKEKHMRLNEETEYKEESEKNDLLSLKQEKELKITQLRMQNIELIKKLEAEKSEIDNKLSQNREQKIKRIETEINTLQLNTDEDDVVKDLQRQLMVMMEEKEQEKQHKDDNEMKELKQIEMDKELSSLKEEMEMMFQKKSEFEQLKLKQTREYEEKNIEHLIEMEKLKQSVNTIQLDHPLTALELANVCNLELKDAEILVAKYDVNGDGKLDMDEFQELRDQIVAYQRQQQKEDDPKGKKKEVKKMVLNYESFIVQRKQKKELEKADHQKRNNQRKELLKLNRNQLAKKCRQANLSVEGTKADLVKRLMTKQQETETNEQNDGDDDAFQD
eukprot:220125_1